MANNLSLPLEEAVPIYRQAGKMLAGMHAQGIYHADTKPANFVFTRSSFGGPLLTIIDCDDIRVSLFLSRRCCRKNLAQFIGCLWCLQKMTTRVALAQAFLRGYGSLAANAAGSVLRSPAEQRKLAAICHKLYPRHRLENGQLLQELFDPEKISLLEAPAD